MSLRPDPEESARAVAELVGHRVDARLIADAQREQAEVERRRAALRTLPVRVRQAAGEPWFDEVRRTAPAVVEAREALRQAENELQAALRAANDEGASLDLLRTILEPLGILVTRATVRNMINRNH